MTTDSWFVQSAIGQCYRFTRAGSLLLAFQNNYIIRYFRTKCPKIFALKRRENRDNFCSRFCLANAWTIFDSVFGFPIL